MGLVLLGTVIGLVGVGAALVAGHPVWLALLMMPAFGSGAVLILAATAMIRERPRRQTESHSVQRAV